MADKILHRMIIGKPMAWPRPRFANGRGFLPKPYKEWKKNFQASLIQSLRVAGWPRASEKKFAVRCVFAFKMHYRHPSDGLNYRFCGDHVGDVDNLLKAILDGMNGIVFADDRQVVEVIARKIHVEDGQLPWTSIAVEEAREEV